MIGLEGVLQEKADAAVSCGCWGIVVEGVESITSGVWLVPRGDECQVRNTSVGMVEEVEHLGTEVNGVAFVDREVALNRDIASKDTWGIAVIAIDAPALGVSIANIKMVLTECR